MFLGKDVVVVVVVVIFNILLLAPQTNINVFIYSIACEKSNIDFINNI